MTKIDFNIADIVVTSKGLYGTVVYIDTINDKSIISIGHKKVQLSNNQIRSVVDKVYVVCYCTNGCESFNRRITLPKQFQLFDFTDPLANALFEYCKTTISKTYANPFTITHIKI